MTLYEFFINNKGRPIHKCAHYFSIYEQFFARYLGTPVLFLEIGTGGGGSSQMWKTYFGPTARIVSIDIRPECAAFEDDQVRVRIGSQADITFLASVLDEFGTPDIVLDDGSHQMNHICETFKFLYGKTAPDGIYMIEDLHTAYWPEYGGGLRQQGSFFEYCKDLIDEIHYSYTRGAIPPNEFAKATVGMHFYDSIVVFERGEEQSKQSLVTGDSSKYKIG